MRPSQQILAAAVLGISVLLASFGYDQWRHYREEVVEAERNVSSAAAVLAAHTARTFDAAQRALRAVARVHEDALRNGYAAATSHRLLKAIHGGSPVFRSIGWVDAEGNRKVSSLFADPPPLNVADQEQFRALRDRPDEGRALYVPAPVRSQILDAWIVSVSLRLDDPDGGFNGIAGGVVDLDYFARVFRSIALGEHDVVTLFRADGVILAREPLDASLLGTSLAGRPFMTDVVRRAPNGVFRTLGLSDKAKRIVGYAVDPDSGFIVTVAARNDEVLEPFWSDFALAGTRTGLIVLAIGWGAWLLVRQTRRREQLASELRFNEARFRDFAASSGDWFWETDAEHRIVWVSDTVEVATGVPAKWHYGRTRLELIAPEAMPAERWEEHLADLGERRSFRDFEYLRRGPTGDRWIRISGVPVFDEEGRFEGYRGSGRDVTELRRAEQRLRDAVESLPATFLLFDAEDRLIYTNGNAGRAAPELAEVDRVGDRFETILRRSLETGALRDAAADPEAWFEWRLERHRAAEGSTLVRVGDRVVDIIERPTSEGGIIVLRFDVTDREMALAAAEAARAAADEANRAKSEFLSSMSHELRTPLNAIIGFGQILQLDREGRLSAEQRQYSEHVVRSGEHLLSLVNEVLDLAGVEAGRLRLSLEPVPVDSVLREAIKTMQPVAQKAGIDLGLVGSVAVPDVQADAQRLRQILLNLLSNAIKYNRADGSVTVAVEASEDGCVRISVTDTGRGISAEQLAHLFVPFQRLGAEFTHIEGTGIGLALSKRLIEAMEGRIGASSQPGRGSTFWIEVPVAASAAPRPPLEASRDASPLAAAGGYSVLYVEDNPLNVSLMDYLLETLPAVTMYAAPSGEIGLDLARAQRPDVIVLDLNLPGMGGFEVLERLRRDPETAGIPVIALTASAMPSDVKRGLAAGFFRYLAKPLKFDEFLSCIDDALSRRSAAAGPG
ncbi:hypothetical protein GCM10017083_50550 [Thalassobaculum fulvum]|uniref:histidine kinase n=1 Tax=Thalassobaculum fulvum TaxID=1633335 RepID=A0A918XY92_9PROT|nr:hypothetical protein GCM10017083_50550 [Thalassobaculum fulvum]